MIQFIDLTQPDLQASGTLTNWNTRRADLLGSQTLVIFRVGLVFEEYTEHVSPSEHGLNFAWQLSSATKGLTGMSQLPLPLQDSCCSSWLVATDGSLLKGVQRSTRSFRLPGAEGPEDCAALGITHDNCPAPTPESGVVSGRSLEQSHKP